MKICVWDDDFDTAKEWKSQLEDVLRDSGALIKASTASDIERELHILHQRRKSFLACGQDAYANEVTELDDTDILVVDNDLFDLKHFSDLSAETVASRVGVYTDCACIVVLNLSPDLDFDLTLLGHPESKADLHINDRFVSDSGLWRQCPKDDGGFRPWQWPLLLSAVELHKRRIADLLELLEGNDGDVPVLDYFEFGERSKRRLSRSARAFLHPIKRAEKTSFIDFIRDNAKAVNRRDGEVIARRNDVQKIARIGARRIGKWLARYVLGPQDVLMDFPHLVEKLPFIVPDDKQQSVRFWNSCAKLQGTPIGREEEFGVQRFHMEDWFDRPVFWADGVESEENLERLLAKTDANPGGLVFCEDSSAFHSADDCDQFVAAYNSMSDVRFVRWLREEGPDHKIRASEPVGDLRSHLQ